MKIPTIEYSISTHSFGSSTAQENLIDASIKGDIGKVKALIPLMLRVMMDMELQLQVKGIKR